MSRTVSSRIPRELHEKLLERCNILGCTINEFMLESLKMSLDGYSDFDFGNESNGLPKALETKPEPPQTRTKLTNVRIIYD